MSVGEGHGRHSENLEQCRGTLRRRGNGMSGKLAWELGRPRLVYRRRPVVTASINSGPVKGSGKPGWGVGGAHNTDDGKDSITLSEGRSPTLLKRLKRVRVRECQKLITP
jgi:hypothetical protein